jgi:hypothetical protein
VQWIPLYTLFLIKFIEDRSWKHILLTGLFLVCHILFSFPYYLAYLPIHTTVILAFISILHIRKHEQGVRGFMKDIVSHEALKAWLKVGSVLVAAIVIFGVFYVSVTGGSGTMSSFTRTTEQLEELSLTPTDYLFPHPRSTFLKGNFKETYWDEFRPGKNPDSFVAYIGFIALGLMIYGLIKGKGSMKWMFLAGAVVAFISTLGPKLFGIPTPSGLIFSLYAPFARRILIYKVFVQMCIAGLAGMGIAVLVKRVKSDGALITLLAVLTVCILAEYSIASSELSVNLETNPEIYNSISNLPDESILFETPALRNNGNSYQGYYYYQTIHRKRLFNSYQGTSNLPEYLQPFYEQMTIPIESCDYANLAALRYLGVTHLTYHWYVGTSTVRFGSFAAPALYNTDVEGLNPIYQSDRNPLMDSYTSPFDYTFADLYEITAEPCPIALIYDYCSPYDHLPGVLEQDFLLTFSSRFTAGWASALMDSASTFYYPLPDGENLDRVVKKDGLVTTVNMSGEPVDFTVSFVAASPDSGRMVEVKWNGREVIGTFEIGPRERRYTVENMRLEGSGQGTLTISTANVPYRYDLGDGGIPAGAVLRNFRVIVK